MECSRRSAQKPNAEHSWALAVLESRQPTRPNAEHSWALAVLEPRQPTRQPHLRFESTSIQHRQSIFEGGGQRRRRRMCVCELESHCSH